MPPIPPDTTVIATSGAPDGAATVCVAPLPLRAQLGQLVWPAVYGDRLGEAAAQLAAWGVGGAVVMTAPSANVAEQLGALRNAGAIPLLLATDEEGGNVQRFKSLGAIPAPATVAETMTPAAAGALVAEHATAVAAAGIDVVFAPVVDVQPADGEGPIGDRSFGSDPEAVTAYGAAYVNAWQRAGITPVLKHFPGHGDANGDTHEVFAFTPPLETLRTRDLIPYEALAATGAAVMVGHLAVPGLTEPGVPASLSPSAISMLREQYGFGDALVFTDALGMSAVTSRYTVAEAAELAIVAGADVVVFTNTDQTAAVIDRLVDAVNTGRLSLARVEDALTRLLRRKGLDPCGVAP